MAAFNRAIAIVVALVILAGAVVTVLVAAGVTTPEVLPYGLFETELQRAADATGGYQVANVAVAVVMGLGMVVLLLFEFMPSNRPMLLLVSSTEAGNTTIDRGSVRVLAETTAAPVRNVRDARCDVADKAGGLVISCWASVALGGSIPEVSAELQSKIAQAVEHLTGLAVAQVDVNARYERVEGKKVSVR